MKILPVLAATLPLLVAAGAAMAGTYSGSWPFIVSDSQYFNGNHCLALTDDGSGGWTHSGPAVLDGQDDGSFALIGKTLLVSIELEGDYMNASTVITARAAGGTIGKGAFTEVYDGPSIDTGKVVFGTKGGC